MRHLVHSVLALFVFTILTGFAYPLVIYGFGRIVTPGKAEGSLVLNKSGELVGSALIGQAFSSEKYFWSRPSATSPFSYNAAASSGANLGPTNPTLLASIRDRVKSFLESNEGAVKPVPVDLVTASGSGLDPEISLAGAVYQIERVSRARQLPSSDVRRLVDKYTRKPVFVIFGEARVNVLLLNLALDEESP